MSCHQSDNTKKDGIQTMILQLRKGHKGDTFFKVYDCKDDEFKLELF